MSVLSAKAIARFADAVRMRPEDAVTFIRNATEDTRRAIAERYTHTLSPVEAELVNNAKGRRQGAEYIRIGLIDPIAIRLALAEDNGEPSDGRLKEPAAAKAARERYDSYHRSN
jgi:hypothetical protein